MPRSPFDCVVRTLTIGTPPEGLLIDEPANMFLLPTLPRVEADGCFSIGRFTTTDYALFPTVLVE